MNSAEKSRIEAIDIMKCLAALFVVNSHLKGCYGPLAMLSTGGSLGNVLFFFCSGFCLSMGGFDRLDNWYKRRISRIYPTVISWAFLSAVVARGDMLGEILNPGGWFINAIMVYYIILWLIERYCSKYNCYFLIAYFFALFVYALLNLEPATFSQTMYFLSEDNHFPYVLFFFYMLLGSVVSGNEFWKKINPWVGLVMLFMGIFGYYLILYIQTRVNDYPWIQFFSTIPLILVPIAMLRLCETRIIRQLYHLPNIGYLIYAIGALCLQIYLVQGFAIKYACANFTIPARLFIALFLISFLSYFTFVLSNFVKQSFSSGPYEWKRIFMLPKHME